MNVKAALRWALYYRSVAWIFGVIWLGFLGLAFYLGLDDVLIAMRYRDLGTLLQPGFVIPPLVVTLVGFVIWQFGKSVVFYKTLAEAVDEQMAERFDARMVKSEILEVLDDRLAEMEQEVRSTRSAVEEMETAEPPTSQSGQGGFDFGN